MKPELIAQLKAAGFDQLGDNQDGYTNEEGYEPSLSELIEACGDDFKLLLAGRKQPKDFIAASYNIFDELDILNSLEMEYHHFGIGPTPEEAVAQLWLVLNKK